MKRGFLAPFAVSVGIALAGTGAAATPNSIEQPSVDKRVEGPSTTVQPQHFVIEQASQQEFEIAQHVSHASHESHASHTSHCSSYC